MSNAATRLSTITSRMRRACEAAGRDPATVSLLAVSKTFPAQAISALADCGQRAFGESYLQEARAKQIALAGRDLLWHFIGPIQSNKTREIAENFDWVESVDRLRIATRLSEQRPEALAPMQVLVQVNISGEATKSGCAPEDALELCAAVAALPRLQLRGLMAIPAPTEDPQCERGAFARLRELHRNIAASGRVDAARFNCLSAGMSDDLEAAIMEGSTQVRIGTALFGERHYA